MRTERRRPSGTRANLPTWTWPAPTHEALPLTPRMSALLQSEGASARALARWCGITGAAAVAVCAALGLSGVIGWDPVVVIVCGALGVPFTMLLLWRRGWAYAADLAGGRYIRLSGPLTLDSAQGEVGPPDHYFRVDDQAFAVTARISEELRQVEWGTVVYAPRSHTLFALYDWSGHVRLHDPGYIPEGRGPRANGAWSPSPAPRPPLPYPARTLVRSRLAVRRRALHHAPTLRAPHR